jgi:hypothetical protein
MQITQLIKHVPIRRDYLFKTLLRAIRDLMAEHFHKTGLINIKSSKKIIKAEKTIKYAAAEFLASAVQGENNITKNDIRGVMLIIYPKVFGPSTGKEMKDA